MSMLLRDFKTIRDHFAWLCSTELYRRHPWRVTIKMWLWFARELASKQHVFRTSDGVYLATMPRNFSSLLMYVQSDRDPEIMSFIRRAVPAGGMFVDVGANIGTYAVRASQIVGPQGRVVAIEAHPLTFGFLQRTIALNGFTNVTALNVAAGDTRKNVGMEFVSTNPGESHVRPDDNAGIAMRPLDECLTELGITAIDYLKIDVEGYELFVLRGARRIIEASRNIIVQIELVEEHASRYRHSIMDVVTLLFSHGLHPHRVDAHGQIRAVSQQELDRPGDYLWAFRVLS